MLRSVAKIRARREQSTGAETLYRQLLARITALVWRRAARMAIRCRPRGGPDDEAVRQTLNDVEKFSDSERDKAYSLALAAYEARDKADREFALLAPQWPAHRQPAADRAALRLGYFELTTGRVPPKVAINEAVELARVFGGERSPGFVNGLLSRVLQRINSESAASAAIEAPTEGGSQ